MHGVGQTRSTRVESLSLSLFLSPSFLLVFSLHLLYTNLSCSAMSIRTHPICYLYPPSPYLLMLFYPFVLALIGAARLA